jgi:triacylglycerol lipase
VLARIQRLIALALTLTVLGSATLGIRIGQPLLGAAVAATVVTGYLVVLAIEFGVLRASYAQGDPDRPGIAQLLRAWLAETTGAPRVFLWRQPFRSQSQPDHLPTSLHTGRGVLFVHGFFCNRGLWNPLLRRLRRAGIPFIAINLEPVFASIDSHRRLIENAVRQLERTTTLPPVLVAHSMGGLALRAWLGDDAKHARFHRLVTIATPHAGTRLAIRGFGANVLQMRPRNDWLAALDAQTPAAVRERTTCFWSHCDNIVVPARNATLAGADNRHLEGTPHVQMIDHPAVIDEVLALTALASGAPSAH